MPKTKNYILLGLLSLSVLLSVYEGLQYVFGYDPAPHALQLWGLGFLLLVIMWVDNDSRIHRRNERCFDYFFFVYIFSPVYIPYYFYRTRGFVKGSAFLIGLLLLYKLSLLTKWSLCLIMTAW